jgi:SagB-type dehydrogenase family enzyme
METQHADIWFTAEISAPQDVVDACLGFHARSSLSLRSLLDDPGGDSAEWKALLAQIEFADCEFILNGASTELKIEGHGAIGALSRKGSCRNFERLAIGRASFDRLIASAFLARDAQGHRNYPSAGGVYPVEIVLLPLNAGITGVPGGAYHVLPRSRSLEKIADGTQAARCATFLLSSAGKIGSPSLVIIYLAHLARPIVKYKYRGYRHAVIEVGCALQQADLVATATGLATLPYSRFSELGLCKYLALNPLVLLPLCVQFVGVRLNEKQALV